MHILVTGGAGFVGSHLVQRLVEQDHKVVVLDDFTTGRKENIPKGVARVLEKDVRTPLIDRVVNLDRIYHLACPASPMAYQQNKSRTIDVAFSGTRNVLDFAHHSKCRVLIASTSEVYGDPSVHPQHESYFGYVNPFGPRACYDEGKRAAEALAFGHLADCRIARIFNTYGPRMQRNDGRVVSNFICQALAGEPLTVYGDGHQTRSLCYVSDLVEGLIALMESEVYGPVNLGNPHEIRILDLARNILELTGKGSTIAYKDFPKDDPHRRCPDISRAMAYLRWEPKVPLDEGLAKTIDYFR